MKQTFKFLTIAVLVLAGAMTTGCAAQFDEPQQPQEKNGTVTLSTTVGFDAASTKALTADGVKTFEAGDKIVVIYKDTDNKTQRAESSALQNNGDITNGGKRAAFSVTLTNPAPDGAVRYIYPAAMAKTTVETNADVNSDDGTIRFTQLKSQDGTLATLAANYDLAVYDGSLTEGAALPSGVTLSNQLAILELTVKNAGSSVNGSVTKLSVFDGTNVYKISRSAVAEPIYVAMRPVSNDKTIHFCAATDNKKIYRKSVSDKTLSRSNIYPVNLTTTETTGTALEFLTADFEAQNGDTLSGILLGSYKISTAETDQNDPAITVWLDGVDINHSYSIAPGESGIRCQGNVNLVLAAGSVNYVTACTSSKGYAGIFIPSARTLTISGSGSLTATGKGDSSEYYRGGAGIGGYYQGYAGNIVITGGTIIAQGGRGAAGIGGGSNSGAETLGCGNITISGGDVTALGGNFGAGIGTGTARVHSNTLKNKCGDIFINGGTVTATGGNAAAGIGGGYAQGNSQQRDAEVKCGDITISSGVTCVTATKGGSVAPNSIGQGYANDPLYSKQTCGTITIDGTTSFTFTTSTDQFEHFNSTLSTTTSENDTWKLTHK